jgi:serine/threonine-protein kinase
MMIEQLKDQHRIKINKGWSTDEKYYIETQSHEKYLLRTASLEFYERKKQEFQRMKEAYALGIPMPEPLDFKVVNEEVHSLFSWIEGKDSEDILPALTEENQYRLGVAAGEILRKIHTIPAPDNIEKWADKFNRKIDRNINNYQHCPLKYEKGHIFIKYIEANRDLIKNRPQVFQHGDYHTGNMILSSQNELGIIDFNRWDYGDPWEEFNRIDFTAELSPIFATGQVDGYFKQEPPIEFFKLLALYISTNTLNALPWALSYSDRDVATMKRKAAAVLEWYEDMERIIPNWYKKELRKNYSKK